MAIDGRGLSGQAGKMRQPLRYRGAEIDRERIGGGDAHDAGEAAHGHHCSHADHEET